MQQTENKNRLYIILSGALTSDFLNIILGVIIGIGINIATVQNPNTQYYHAVLFTSLCSVFLVLLIKLRKRLDENFAARTAYPETLKTKWKFASDFDSKSTVFQFYTYLILALVFFILSIYQINLGNNMVSRTPTVQDVLIQVKKTDSVINTLGKESLLHRRIIMETKESIEKLRNQPLRPKR